ncbi:MAG: family 16 glycoside hydrolase [Balneolales bacterium]
MAKLWLPLIIGFITITIGCNTTVPETASEEVWEDLFNQENLDGWDLKLTGYELTVNFGNTFRVEDKLLKVRFDQYEDRFGHIFYKKPFSHYRLKVEYRFVGEQIAAVWMKLLATTKPFSSKMALWQVNFKAFV